MTDRAANLSRADLMSVTGILGGSYFVSTADWAAGSHGLRAYTSRGAPRHRRGSTLPLFVGRMLMRESIGAN